MSHRLIGRAAGLLESLVDGGGIGIENNGHGDEDLGSWMEDQAAVRPPSTV